MMKKFFPAAAASIAVSFLFVIVACGSTTISTDITTGGALTVSGNSTFGDAATDVNLFTGTLQASTTALFTSGLTTYGNSTFGDAATDVNLFTGTLQASTTALFTSGLTTYGNSTFGDAATDVNLFTGTLQASTTALFTATTTHYNGAVIGPSGSALYKVLVGTCTVNFGSAFTADLATTTNCTATGVLAGDKIFMTPTKLDQYMVFSSASSTGSNVIQVAVFNSSTSTDITIDTTDTWYWMAIR
ncbi:MAG: hypothetical protein PHC85_02580 [Candidatus Pacebacteria bacterium]|nr:hypothetical protein [Candidatus Paceibacterota bacterium]